MFDGIGRGWPSFFIRTGTGCRQGDQSPDTPRLAVSGVSRYNERPVKENA